MSPTPAVEVHRRPAPQSLSALPEELVRYLAADGKRWSFQSASREALTVLYRRGIRPLRVKDITDKAVRALVEDALLPNDEGYIQLWDAVLCVQSEDAVAVDQERKAQLLSPDERAAQDIAALEDQLQRLFRATGQHSGAPILQGELPRLKEQVINATGGVTIG